MESHWWNKEVETLDRTTLQELQLKRLKETISSAFKTPHYKKVLKEAGIKGPEDIRTLADLRKIPFTSKNDLRDGYPFGFLAVPLDEVVRLHSSSGTTGKPTVIYQTKEDLENWTDLVARSITATGATKKDIFQNMMGYGLFTGGLGLHYGAERVGMMVIPVSSGNTLRQLQFMKDFKTTIVHATPSYLLHIHSKLEEYGVKPADLFLKKAYIGAEPHSENTRKKIEELYGIDAYNSYGLSEMNGPGVAFECTHKCGMHIWEDSYIVEVIDPETGEPRGPEEEGEIVFTIIKRNATPLLRYRTRDLARIYESPCACGRTHRRLSRITGRSDDMLIINGVNVFPSQIEEVLMKITDVGTNYQIYLNTDGVLDRLTVKVEIKPQLFKGDIHQLDMLKGTIQEKIRALITLNPVIELHEPGALPVFEGKAKRVVDERTRI